MEVRSTLTKCPGTSMLIPSQSGRCASPSSISRFLGANRLAQAEWYASLVLAICKGRLWWLMNKQVLTNTIHEIDMLQYWLGSITEVHAIEGLKERPFPVDSTVQ